MNNRRTHNAGASFMGALDALIQSPTTARDARLAAELGDRASSRIDAAVTTLAVVALVGLGVWMLR